MFPSVLYDCSGLTNVEQVLKGKRDYLGVKLVLSFQRQYQRLYVMLALYIYLYDTQSNPPLVKILTDGGILSLFHLFLEYVTNPNAPYIEEDGFVKTNFIREWEENPDFVRYWIGLSCVRKNKELIIF